MNKKRKVFIEEYLSKRPAFDFNCPDLESFSFKEDQIFHRLALGAPADFAMYALKIKRQFFYMPEDLKNEIWFELETENKTEDEIKKIILQIIESHFLH